MNKVTLKHISFLLENQSCHFDQNTCNWEASQGWKLTYYGKRPHQYDWQGGLGKIIQNVCNTFVMTSLHFFISLNVFAIIHPVCSNYGDGFCSCMYMPADLSFILLRAKLVAIICILLYM